jgi:hypothetical protein
MGARDVSVSPKGWRHQPKGKLPLLNPNARQKDSEVNSREVPEQGAQAMSAVTAVFLKSCAAAFGNQIGFAQSENAKQVREEQRPTTDKRRSVCMGLPE